MQNKNENRKSGNSLKVKKPFNPQKRIAELKLENRHLEASLQRLYDFKTRSKEELLKMGYTPQAVLAQRTPEDYLRYSKTVSNIQMSIAINKNEIVLISHMMGEIIHEGE